MTETAFKVDPGAFIEGKERAEAREHLREYFTSYTGCRFEEIADSAEPNRVTESDLVAVSMLSVNVPAQSAIWLLGPGASEVSALLASIDPEATIWDDDVDLSKDGAAWGLWTLVRNRRFPDGVGASGMGRTKTSKLLAAKRPHLIPIYDTVVASALLPSRAANDWELWRHRLRGQQGHTLKRDVEALRDEAGVPHHVSVLRILDIVVWMASRRGKL